jgi:hypothetical protein
MKTRTIVLVGVLVAAAVVATIRAALACRSA